MLTRQEIETGYPEELRAFADLLRGLSPEELALPTRCAGWTVGDVGAHVVGGLADVVNFRLDGVGTPEWTNRQVQERKGRTGVELAEELDGLIKTGTDMLAAFDDAAWNGPAPEGVVGTLGQGVETLLYDTYVHADDIRSALGQPTRSSPAGVGASVHHIAFALEDQGHAPLTLELTGVAPVEVGGGGQRVSGDAHQFVMAATGRGDLSQFGLGPEANIYREQ